MERVSASATRSALSRLLRAGLALLLLHGSAAVAAAAPPSNDELRILAYNVYMRPTTLFLNGQMMRADRMPPFLAGYDVIVFSELFDDEVRNRLLGLIRSTYPHQTPIVGKDEGAEQDGGVLIVSRWPIVAQENRIFPEDDCGADDCLSEKGVAYAAIRKNGGDYHVFGTHLQASAGEHPRRMRQLRFVKGFIDDRRIPRNEPVFVAGDLNVNAYDAAQLGDLLTTLDARMPTHSTPLPPTYDKASNSLVSEDASEMLDYVLYQNGWRSPDQSSFVRRVFKVECWREFFFESCRYDLSDHYAVEGRFRFGTAR